MRTPEEIREDLRTLERKFKRQSAELEGELVKSRTGFEVGDTLKANNDENLSIIVTEVTDKGVRGTFTNSDFTMPIRESRMWSKV